MGQSTSSVDLKVSCAQSCNSIKEWGSKDYNTVKVDFAMMKTLEALCKDCTDDSIKNSLCPPSKSDENISSQVQQKEKSNGKEIDTQIVTEQENVPPNGFQVPKQLHLDLKPDHNEDVSTPRSTAASTNASVRGIEKDFKVPALDLSKNVQVDGDMQIVDVPEKQTQGRPPKATEKDASTLELNVALMKWNEIRECLECLEVISIPYGNGIHPDLKVADFKTLLKERQIMLKSGKVLNTDHMVLTTPRKLELNQGVCDRALNGLKTLAQSGVGQYTKLLLLDTESVRKASCSNRKASPRTPQPEVGQKKASPRSEVEQKLVMIRSHIKKVEQEKKEAKQKALEGEAKANKRLEAARKRGLPEAKDEKDQGLDELKAWQMKDQKQQMQVKEWLKSAGFKDVNELARKQLLGIKTRPLHVAVQKGDEEMIKLLLLMGADPHLCNGKNETPLLFAKRISRERSLSADRYLKVASALTPTLA